MSKTKISEKIVYLKKIIDKCFNDIGMIQVDEDHVTASDYYFYDFKNDKDKIIFDPHGRVQLAVWFNPQEPDLINFGPVLTDQFKIFHIYYWKWSSLEFDGKSDEKKSIMSIVSETPEQMQEYLQVLRKLENISVDQEDLYVGFKKMFSSLSKIKVGSGSSQVAKDFKKEKAITIDSNLKKYLRVEKITNLFQTLVAFSYYYGGINDVFAVYKKDDSIEPVSGFRGALMRMASTRLFRKQFESIMLGHQRFDISKYESLLKKAN